MKAKKTKLKTRLQDATKKSKATRAVRKQAKMASSGVKRVQAHLSSRGKRDQVKRDSKSI